MALMLPTSARFLFTAGAVVALAGAAFVGAVPTQAQAPVPVTVRQADGKWQLLRSGKPYFIKGAGGEGQLDLLVTLGGNSVRTWGVENAEKILNEAQKRGLTVTVGLWLRHVDGNFSYSNAAQVAEQKAATLKAVERFKNHPAVLIWGIGNEMEGDGNDPKVFEAIEDIARAVKKADPNHPTMTVMAEIGEGGNKAKQVKALCPDIDILGLNAYGGTASVPERLKASGWTKPYIITEYGPNGPWEWEKTPWGSAVEPNSTEKTNMYLSRYESAIRSQPGWCFGSYAFNWGWKMEATSTWFGLFVPETGERLGPTDALAFAWSGKFPTQRLPEIMYFGTDLAKREVKAGSRYTAQCVVRPGGTADNLTYEWVVRQDNPGNGSILPNQPIPAVASGTNATKGAESQVTVSVPTAPGTYRLYLTVRDGKGGAAVANTPFKVVP